MRGRGQALAVGEAGRRAQCREASGSVSLQARTGTIRPARVGEPRTHGHGIAAAGDSHEHPAITPLGHGGDGPVRGAVGDDGTHLARTVGVLDAGLDPVLVVEAHEDPRLVELLGEGGGELDLNGRVAGEGGEQGALGVVDEAPYDVIRQASEPSTAVTRMSLPLTSTCAGSWVHRPCSHMIRLTSPTYRARARRRHDDAVGHGARPCPRMR